MVRIKKFCCCIPLRIGVLCSTCFVVTAQLLALLCSTDLIGVTFGFLYPSMVANLEVLVQSGDLMILTLPLILAIVFGCVLIYALVKNNSMVLYGYMWYGMTYIAVSVYIYLTAIPFTSFPEESADSKFYIISLLVDVLYHSYIILAVHSLRKDMDELKIIDNENGLADEDIESQPSPTAPLAESGNTAVEKTSL